jgi:diguanylate cyclase (GGDEF)-like protein
MKRKNQEIEKLKKEILLLRKITFKDPLTGLYNRRGFLNEVNRLVKMIDGIQQRMPTNSSNLFENLGLIFVDLDDFKKINDNFGHKVGDMVLKKIAETLEKSLRKFDIVGRWGGDEFVILTLGVGRPIVLSIAQRLKNKVESLVFKEKKKNLNLTASFGATVFSSKDFKIEDYINKTDKAMYRAKKQGKNEIVVV